MEKSAPSPNHSSKGGCVALLNRFLNYEKGTTFLPPFSFGGWVYFIVGFIGALITGWIIFPMLLYSEQPQPMNFDHVLHTNPEITGIGNDPEGCLYCHGFRADGTFTGIPPLETCTECHDLPEFPLGETATERSFLQTYVAHDKEIPWRGYFRQPDCVYFPHIAHVKNAFIDCETCHGDLGREKELPPYRFNRLTGYSINIWGKNIAGWKLNPWDRMKMDDCAECHTESGVEENNACFVCHK